MQTDPEEVVAYALNDLFYENNEINEELKVNLEAAKQDAAHYKNQIL